MSKSPYQCPSDREAPSYQLNPNLAGRSVREVTRPHEMVVLFDSDDGRAVAYRHNGGANYAFADGRAKWYMKGAERGPTIVWEFEPRR
jgi:prepilin-type processing-associated H-X9-DG protein